MLRAVKVEQLTFLSENLKEIFPPQLPGRKYVTESSLGIVGRVLEVEGLPKVENARISNDPALLVSSWFCFE